MRLVDAMFWGSLNKISVQNRRVPIHQLNEISVQNRRVPIPFHRNDQLAIDQVSSEDVQLAVDALDDLVLLSVGVELTIVY